MLAGSKLKANDNRLSLRCDDDDATATATAAASTTY